MKILTQSSVDHERIKVQLPLKLSDKVQKAVQALTESKDILGPIPNTIESDPSEIKAFLDSFFV